jgi:hypothetical protein
VQAMGWLRGLEVTVGGTGSVSRALVPLRALADKTRCGCAVPPAGWAARRRAGIGDHGELRRRLLTLSPGHLPWKVKARSYTSGTGTTMALP